MSAVSCDLIDAHSETMLGRLVSDTLIENHEKSVFVERNGDVFPHVLDYLRHGRWVPFCVLSPNSLAFRFMKKAHALR